MIITSLPLILVFEFVGCNQNSLCIFHHFQCTVCCHRKEDFQTSHFLKRMLSLRHLLTTQVLTEVICSLLEKKVLIYTVIRNWTQSLHCHKCINTTIFFRSDHSFFYNFYIDLVIVKHYRLLLCPNTTFVLIVLIKYFVKCCLVKKK